MIIPADIRPEEIVVVIDTREQRPLNLSPLRTIRGTLATGDYGLRDLPHAIALERKSLPDFIGCVGRDRERFERELDRLRAYPARAVLCEFSLSDLEGGGWRGSVSPQAATASAARWLCDGIPLIFAGNRDRAARIATKMLYLCAREHFRQTRDLLRAVDPTDRETAA